MHAISSYRGDRPTHTNTHKQTHRQDRLQYTAPLSLACSVMSLWPGLCPRPYWVAYGTPPELLASFKGAASRQGHSATSFSLQFKNRASATATWSSVAVEQCNAAKYSDPIAGAGDAYHDQVFLGHVVDEVDVVPAVLDEPVVVLAEAEVRQPLSDRRRNPQYVLVLLHRQQNRQKPMPNPANTTHT